MSRVVVLGWIASLGGMILWLYGYLTTGSSSFVDWHNKTPWWIADYLPNIQAEIGMALMSVGMVVIYWPGKKNKSTLGRRHATYADQAVAPSLDDAE